MPTAKERYQQAVVHYRAGDYERARALLATIQHPKARQLEARLPKAKKRTRRWVVALLVFAVGVGAYAVSVYNVGRESARAAGREILMRSEIQLVCLRVYRDLDNRLEYCEAAAALAMAAYKHEIAHCYDASENAARQERFVSCLADEGVKL